MPHLTLTLDTEQDADLWNEDRRIDYLPNTQEIRQACEEIRAGWTFVEKRRRFVGELIAEEPGDDWRPPVIDTSHLRVRTSCGPGDAI